MDRSFHREESEATMISLTELDPSPIDSPTPIDEKLEVELVDEDAEYSSRATTAGPGLSSHHGAIFYLTRVQRISSYAMSIFTSLHLCNVSLIPAVTRSVPASESYLLMTREIYQTTLSEPLLVALPVVAHVGSGIALRLIRWQQNRKRYGRSASSMYALHKSRAASHVRIWPRLSYISMSGYAFSVFYSAHVFMNRILPLVADGDSSNIGLAYVAHGFARHPIIARAAYLGLIGLGSGHMIWGMAKWLGYAPSTEGLTTNEKLLEDNKSRKQRKRRWLTLHGIVVATIAAWGIGGLGVVARGGLQEGWVGAVYDELFSRVDF